MKEIYFHLLSQISDVLSPLNITITSTLHLLIQFEPS